MKFKRVVCSVCAKEKQIRFCNYCKKETPNNISVELFDKFRLRGIFKLRFPGKGRFKKEVKSGWKSSGDPN